MIKVERLTKRYGNVTAVDAIDFEVDKGEIVGILGPNGAGKSTTVRMLACYLPPTSGRAEVAGFDVFRDSLRAREHIGYMPEHVPLPHDMRVNEYLAFRASLKGVPGRRIKERLADVSDLCGLAEVERKMISTLSKGFRQRVGLADAMIHEPDLLILDEPTIGLDPNQIRQVRELIKNLRRHHTILLSTHILSEVEMTCSRVIIINRGRIEALDTPENLRSRIGSQGEVTMEARTEDPQALAKMRAVRGVKEVIQKKMGEWTRFTLQVENDPRESLH
ncbi:MAG TPA: ATP-binding cassette domain-containing protein, partial [Terrimicrobiaceae bacterium]|nr:ATP-binding cassette domain-containing protein [Terrimicrobiaceae bacterium]